MLKADNLYLKAGYLKTGRMFTVLSTLMALFITLDSVQPSLATETPAQAIRSSIVEKNNLTTSYLDDYNGFKLSVPAEFELYHQGQTTSWIGPKVGGGFIGIYVNAAPLPDIDPQWLQQIYYRHYEQDRFYTEVIPFEVPSEKGTFPALRVKEVDSRRGSRDRKLPDDHHRWHLFVFGNDRIYTWGFTGLYATFQVEQVPQLYEQVIDSIELVAIRD